MKPPTLDPLSTKKKITFKKLFHPSGPFQLTKIRSEWLLIPPYSPFNFRFYTPLCGPFQLTKITFEWLFSRVAPDMEAEFIHAAEGLATVFTAVWSLASVNPHVTLQIFHVCRHKWAILNGAMEFLVCNQRGKIWAQPSHLNKFLWNFILSDF